ncbi:hypothetical protein J437_LFUL014027 [Ladona fulva]|uniref:Uncharacterized protein n=1 Tax=Ladona fulva TaxID=123851 RepID=A0A8K0P891_LADFU|nr:hypothetical protein J437_LFUL014027 [Ladona fulva]
MVTKSKVVEMWECTFDRLVRENGALYDFNKTNPLFTDSPIDPWDAFFGGRTNCVRMFHKAEVESLEECPPLKVVEGLVKCMVVPPPSLYYPILPFRANGKILFPMCKTCALEENQGDCNHGDTDRSITGTWVSDEVKVAVREGYKVMKIHEVWHYTETSTYNPATGEGGLFREYIDCFLKMKQEARGIRTKCIRRY